MRAFIAALVIAYQFSAPGFSQSADDLQKACHGLSIEGVVQQIFTGSTHVLTASLVKFCDGYRTVVDGLSAVRSEVEDIRSRLPPADAILIVDDGDGCPRGWRDVAENEPSVFAGRVALAATGGGPYRYRSVEGYAEHTLTVAEMPAHRHPVSSKPPSDAGLHNGFGGSKESFGLLEVFNPRAPTASGWSRSIHPEFMGSVGGGESYNTMPPYVALYFCKQEPR